MTTLIEQETTINFNQAEANAGIYTASPVMWNRLEKRGYVAHKVDQLAGTDEVVGKWFVVPKTHIKIRAATAKSTDPASIYARKLRAYRMRYGKEAEKVMQEKGILPP